MDKFYVRGCYLAKIAFGLDSREGMGAGESMAPLTTDTDQHDDPLPQGYRSTHTHASPRKDPTGASIAAFDRHDAVGYPELRGRSTPTTEYLG